MPLRKAKVVRGGRKQKKGCPLESVLERITGIWWSRGAMADLTTTSWLLSSVSCKLGHPEILSCVIARQDVRSFPYFDSSPVFVATYLDLPKIK